MTIMDRIIRARVLAKEGLFGQSRDMLYGVATREFCLTMHEDASLEAAWLLLERLEDECRAKAA